MRGRRGTAGLVGKGDDDPAEDCVEGARQSHGVGRHGPPCGPPFRTSAGGTYGTGPRRDREVERATTRPRAVWRGRVRPTGRRSAAGTTADVVVGALPSVGPAYPDVRPGGRPGQAPAPGPRSGGAAPWIAVRGRRGTARPGRGKRRRRGQGPCRGGASVPRVGMLRRDRRRGVAHCGGVRGRPAPGARGEGPASPRERPGRAGPTNGAAATREAVTTTRPRTLPSGTSGPRGRSAGSAVRATADVAVGAPPFAGPPPHHASAPPAPVAARRGGDGDVAGMNPCRRVGPPRDAERFAGRAQ